MKKEEKGKGSLKGSRTVKNSYKSSVYRGFITNRQGVGNKMVIVTIV